MQTLRRYTFKNTGCFRTQVALQEYRYAVRRVVFGHHKANVEDFGHGAHAHGVRPKKSLRASSRGKLC